MIDTGLKDKNVLITGANHGIGAATAKAFARQEAKVFISYYRPPSQYTEEEFAEAREKGVGGKTLYSAMQNQAPDVVIQEIKSIGGVAKAYEIDLENPENIRVLFDTVEKELGPVDVLINNHTHCVQETFDPSLVRDEGFSIAVTSAESIDKHFAINSRAFALMMKEYLNRFLRRDANWGRIINISTDAAHSHQRNISYAASKHAVESYSRSAAAEMGKYGITVNIVAPGPIQTGYIAPEQESEIATGTPLGRVGEPSDVADVILFLASEQALWLTGQLLYVGGGWRMHQ